MAYLFPFHVNVPSGISGNAVVGIPAYTEMYISSIGAYLRSLTTGPYQIQVRDPVANIVIHSFTFNSAGIQESEAIDFYVPPNNGIAVDVIALGTGAGPVSLTIWAYVP